MAKEKLRRYSEINSFQNVIQPSLVEVFRKDYKFKAKWHNEIFNNNHPIILELGCGKGEYTTELAAKYPEKNFIGIDIKGDRLWVGAKQALSLGLKNVVFLRTSIEFLPSFFTANEIDEIWLTFPDPFKENRRRKKRLTSSVFLKHYRKILKSDGIINLKTDSEILYNYTLSVVQKNNLTLISNTDDLYNSELASITHGITTYYEKKYLSQNKPIHFVQFQLTGNESIEEPEKD
jgi:tRNA (guanine-N7-)-methyltransferase